MITRKQFFKMLGIGAATIAVAPSLLAEDQPSKPFGYYDHPEWFEQNYPPALNTFLPASEVVFLRRHLEEAARDPEYVITTNYEISEVFKVMHHYHVKLGPGAMIIEANNRPASVVMDIRKRLDNDPDFKYNLPSRATWPESKEIIGTRPPLEDLITDWFIFS